MLVQRPSWPSNATESPSENFALHRTAPLTAPDSARPSASSKASNRELLPSQYRAGTRVHSEDLHQSVNADTTSDRSERQRGTRARSKRSQVLTPEFQGN